MNIKNDHIETMEELVYSKPRVNYLSTKKRFGEINLSLKSQAYNSHRFRDFHMFSCAETLAFNRKEDFAENMYGLGKSTSRITFISPAQYSKYCLEDYVYNGHQLFFRRYSGYKSTTKKINYFKRACLVAQKQYVSYLDRKDIRRDIFILSFIHRKEKA